MYRADISKSGKIKTGFMRGITGLGVFLIIFSTIQTGLLIYLEGSANARAQNPLEAMADGHSPEPLQSERLQKQSEFRGAVSQHVQDQANDNSNPGNIENLPTDRDPGTEDRSKRTLNSRTYNDGSTKVVELSGQNTSYADNNTGELKDINTELKEDDHYIDDANKRKSFWQKLKFWDKVRAYKADGGPLKAKFPILRDNDGITVELNSQQINMRPVGGKSGVKPEHIKNDDGSTAVRYADVWEGVDLVYEYHGESVKEMIVLRERPKQANFEFEFDSNVSFKQLENDEVGVVKNGQTLFTIPPITVIAAQKGPVSDSGARYEFDKNRLTTSIDWNWLNQQEKENYPITIDPSINAHQAQNGISANTSNYWSYKSDGYQCNGVTCFQNVGWLEDNGHKTWQSMMRIPFDETLGKDLVYARLDVAKANKEYTWTGTGNSHRYWVTWAPCFGFGCVNGGAPWIPFDITDHGWIDVTSLIQWMKDNGQSGGWLMIHGDDSPYKALDERGSLLSMVYNRRPGKPALSMPGNQTTQTTAMPQLITNAAADPDGDAVDYQFEIYDGDTLIAESPRQNSTKWVVPDGILQDGGTYKWRAVVRDTYTTTWGSGTLTGTPVASDFSKFSVDLRLGNKDKTQAYDELGPIAANLANGNAYTSIETHSIDALGGGIGIGLDYNTPQMSQRGLTASYSNSGQEVLKRTDPNIDFDWNASSPAPGIVDKDNFSVSWKGYFIAPKTGTYKFGGGMDDKMDFNIDPEGDGTMTRLFDYNCCSNQTWSNNTVYLEEGKSYRIDANFYEYVGAARAYLWVQAPGHNGQIVPQDWLRTLDFSPTNNKQGLRAEFYKDYDQSRQFKPNQQPYLVKNYNQVSLNWGENSSTSYDPGGNYSDNFLARFSGYITIPTTGMYSFGAKGDDGKRLYINGNNVGEQWNTSLQEVWSNNMNFNAGDVVPVVLEYFESGGNADVSLKWQGAAGAGVIPASALSTSYRDLPDGWSLNLDTTGAVNYQSLRVVAGGNVALISGDGTRHVYQHTGSGYKPPANEYGVLSKNEDGSYTFKDANGQVYSFNVDGVLTRVTLPADDRKPAALRYEYQGQSGVPRLKKIVDGVDDQRWGELFYGGDSQCQTPSGFDAAPAGFLCAFVTYDGQTTHFYYKEKQLSRVELPGSSITDVGNDAKGRLVSVRGALANDAIATGTRNSNDELLSQIFYDEIGRVSSVKAPAAEAGGWRQENSLVYGYKNTKRHVVGHAEPQGYSQYVEYDDLGRTTKVCDMQGLCSEQEWHEEKDLLLSSTNALGQMSSTHYDEEDRPIDSYGAAPKEWFNDWDWKLPAGKHLTKGQALKSSDGRFRFAYQTDGNLVVYGPSGATWASNTGGKASTSLLLQNDGNLVLYNSGAAVWASGAGGDSTSYLIMQTNGNLLLRYKPIGGGTTHYWHTNTGGYAVDQIYGGDYLTPKSANIGQMPRVSTAYDEGITGPEVVWYNFKNDSLHGDPLYRETGFEQSNPSKLWINTTNSASPAVPVTPTDGATNVGFRATGQIKPPTSGNYTLSLWHANAARVWVNDQLVMDGWSHRSNSVATKSATVSLKSYQENKLTVEYANAGGGDTVFRLEMSGNGVSTTGGVWGNVLKPGYGLTTSSTVYDSQLGNRTSTTNYGSRPEYGLAQSATLDPAGLNLTSSSSYEEPGVGYLRQTDKSLPGSSTPTFSYSYYGAQETADNPCTPETEAYRQAGRMKLKTEADPDAAGTQQAITHQTIYDAAGREVASRINGDPWTCVTFDARGRAAQTVTPDINGRPGRTITFDYAFEGSPFKSQTVDSVSGTTTAEIDLLGRTTAGTDQFGYSFSMSYDNFGRMLSQTSPVGTEEYTYDTIGRVTNYKLDGVNYATISYDQYSRIQNIVYDQAASGANKLKLEQIKYDALNRNSGTVYRFSDNKTFDETVNTSVSGLVTGYSDAYNGQSVTNTYTYDKANRLTEAVIDKNKYEYSYSTPNSTTCNQSSANLSAHKNSNRTSFKHTNLTNSAVLADQNYCYDQADRLISTSDAQVGVPVYDDRGNVTELAGNSTPIILEYDASDSNIAIEQGDNRIEYVKTASGAVIRKKVYQDSVLTESYRYVAGGKVMQNCDLADDNACGTTDKYISLTGGVTLTISPNNPIPVEQATYSVTNFHGDTAITANASGTSTSSVHVYEPFGQTASSQTFNTNNTPNNATDQGMGWAANPTRKQESGLTIPLIQMGARVYLPTLGRFLQVDPVENGTANSYTYVNDPINSNDYSGMFCLQGCYRPILQGPGAIKLKGPLKVVKQNTSSIRIATINSPAAPRPPARPTPKAVAPPKPKVTFNNRELVDFRAMRPSDAMFRSQPPRKPEGFSWQKMWPRIEHSLDTGSKFSDTAQGIGYTVGCGVGAAPAFYAAAPTLGGTLFLAGAGCAAGVEPGGYLGQVIGAGVGLVVGLFTYNGN